MLVDKKKLLVYNVEYEMQDDLGKLVTWKANVLCMDGHEDAEKFIRKYTGKGINVLSLSRLTNLDAVTDDAIDYIVKGSGYQVTI
jgi:hypothetical protein